MGGKARENNLDTIDTDRDSNVTFRLGISKGWKKVIFLPLSPFYHLQVSHVVIPELNYMFHTAEHLNKYRGNRNGNFKWQTPPEKVTCSKLERKIQYGPDRHFSHEGIMCFYHKEAFFFYHLGDTFNKHAGS